MKFCWCTVSVNNLDESVQFYQEITGLKLNRRYAAGNGAEIAFLGEGETEVELIAYGKGQVHIGEDISLGFVVKSVDEMMAFVQQKGIKIHSGPFQPNPHIKFFFVTDPNGLKIQFVEHM